MVQVQVMEAEEGKSAISLPKVALPNSPKRLGRPLVSGGFGLALARPWTRL